MKQYLQLVREVLTQGTPVPSVQGVGALRLGYVPKMTFDFSECHPVLTTRDMRGSMRAIVVEKLWMDSGSTSIKPLHDQGVHIWDKWNLPNTRTRPEWQRPLNDLGPIYGHQFRNYGATRRKDGSYRNDGFDQISFILDGLKNDRYNRRLQMTTFNPKDMPHQYIACCHGDIHFFVEKDGLRASHVQRSCDLLTGGAFDIVTYAYMLEMMGQCSGLPALGYETTLHDCHIYLNQVAKLLGLLYPTGEFDENGDEKMEIDERVLRWAEGSNRSLEELYSFETRVLEAATNGNELADMLSRQPRPLPRLKIHPQKFDYFSFRPNDLSMCGYNPHPAIKGIPVLQ